MSTVDTTTEDQRAEWNVLVTRMRELAEASHGAEQEAGSWLSWAIRCGGDMELAQEQALAEARKAVEFWAERSSLQEQYEAHPYTAVVRARTEARR